MNQKQIFSYKEVYDNTLQYFNGDELATNVWISKYSLKELTSDGNILYYEKTPVDMFHRLTNELYRAGLKYKNPLSYDEIYELIKDFKYVVPQGRPMAGIGNDNDVTSISNCFVVSYPNQDSYGTIAKVDQEIMQISKRGGGIGTDLSGYRPANSKVKNAAMTSTGPVEICANRFSNTIREVGQNGRRGALMLSMDIDHNDAESFIDAKMEDGKITGANISVKIKDYWLNSFINNENPNKENERLWKKIIHNAWAKAEPGILFWDTIINESVPDCYSEFGFKTLSTNPCGEIPLSNKDSCRLMLLNLYSYVKNPFSDEAVFDYNLLRDHSRKIMKIMDNMIDLELEKIDKIIEKIKSDPEDEATKKIELDLWKEIRRIGETGRRSGIGVTAEGDMLAALGFKYGTPEATDFSAEIHRIISTNVYISSCDLVQNDGRPMFECFNWELEKNNPFINRLTSFSDKDSQELSDKIVKGRRNIACLTIPPAGSTSLMTQTTSGIEPLFMPYYSRNRKIDKNSGIKADFIDGTGDWFQTYFVIHHKFVVWYSVLKNISITDASNFLSSMKEEELDKLFEISPYFGATSRDVDWVEKVRMQGAIQKFIDHSISATTNIPADTSEEVVREIYETSWKSGCKGMTIYRDGCRDGVLNSTKDKKKEESQNGQLGFPEKRPKSIQGKVVRFSNGGEKWVSVVGIINDKPYEIFTGLLDKLNIPQYVEDGFIVKNKEVKLAIDEEGKEIEKFVSRYDFQYKNKNGETITSLGLSEIFNEEYWNYAKLISAALRNYMPIEYVVKMIGSLNLRTQSINSWKNGVVRTLKKFIKDGTSVGEKCPECGGNLVRSSGCISCPSCGWSKCS